MPTSPHDLPDPAAHPAWPPENEDEARFVTRLAMDLCIAQFRANDGFGRLNVPGIVTQVIGTLHEARRQTAKVRAGVFEIRENAAPATAPSAAPEAPPAPQGVVAEARVSRWLNGWAIRCRSPQVSSNRDFQSDGEAAEFAEMLRDAGWTVVFDPEAAPVKALVDDVAEGGHDAS